MAENGATCSRCDMPRATGGKYCREHRNAYMRAWRRNRPISEGERMKSNCRSYTNVLIRRGHLVRGVCRDCGVSDVQAHHPDYSQPRLVVWLCPEHHRVEHRALKALVSHETKVLQEAS